MFDLVMGKMQYFDDDAQLRVFFARFHAFVRNPCLIIIDDFSSFFPAMSAL